MRRRKKRSIINVPVASMGDIAFLLIIFFMVASHLTRERHNIRPARSLDAEEMRMTQISVAIDAEGRLFLQGREIGSADDIESQVRTLMENRTTDNERTVIFMCDRDITKNKFEPVIEAIVKAGGLIGAVGESGEPVVMEME